MNAAVELYGSWALLILTEASLGAKSTFLLMPADILQRKEGDEKLSEEHYTSIETKEGPSKTVHNDVRRVVWQDRSDAVGSSRTPPRAGRHKIPSSKQQDQWVREFRSADSGNQTVKRHIITRTRPVEDIVYDEMIGN